MELKDIKLTPLIDTIQLLKISDEEYFSPKYSNYISNSRLGLINPNQGGSPESFFKGFDGSGYNQSFELGSAVHELILQPEYFELAPALNKPTAKLGAMADELYSVWLSRPITNSDIEKASNKIDYYKGKLNENIIQNLREKCTPYWKARKKYKESSDKTTIYLDNKNLDTVVNCVQALTSNKDVQSLLHPEGLLEEPLSINENAILMDVLVNCPNGKEVTLHLKSKLDNFTIDLETDTIVINDVKTIGKIVSEIDNNAIKYHYYRELAMYLYLLKLYVTKEYKIENPKLFANYLVVSTIPQYYTKVKSLTNKDIARGMKEFSTLLRYAAYQMCYNNMSF